MPGHLTQEDKRLLEAAIALRASSSSVYTKSETDALLGTKTASTAFEDHSARHESGGADAIKLDDLAAPDDNTDLDASTAKHGLMKKYPGGTTNFLREDGTFAAPTATVNIKQTEIDFGSTPVSEASFTITDADVSATSQIIGSVAYEAPTGKDLDELDMDALDLKFGPGTGEFTLYARGLDGYVADKFKINYLVG